MKEIGLFVNALQIGVIMFTKQQAIITYLQNRKIIGDQGTIRVQGKNLEVTIDLPGNSNRAKKNPVHTKGGYKKWVPKPKYLKWAYFANVLSRITYGFLAWGKIFMTKTMIIKINSSIS